MQGVDVGTSSDRPVNSLGGSRAKDPDAPRLRFETDSGKFFFWTGSAWKSLIDTTLEAVYQVGSIYISTVSTNPATLFGFGTWTAFGEGRVLVGIDPGQTEFDTVEETGGAKTHTLTSGEMPSHTHTQDAHTHTQDSHNHTVNGITVRHHATTTITGARERLSDIGGLTGDTGGSTKTLTPTNVAATATNQSTTATNQSTGGGGAHNNLQPYIVVYIWKRTA